MTPLSARLLPSLWLAFAAGALLILGSPGPARADEPPTAAQSNDDASGGERPDQLKHVVYLPETIRAQLREEIKDEVLKRAVSEGWATPNAIPAWTQRFRFTADVRLRWEMVFFQRGNANTGMFPDFNAINNGQPFDVLGYDLANDRYLNVDQNRRRPRVRARLGVDVDVGQGFGVGLRFASGDGSNPVSTNQTLGGAPGDFSKLQLWIDRAALTYEPFKGKPSGILLEAGRFGNPFFSTDLIWWSDLSFDGIALQGRVNLGWLELFVNGGGFPYFITGFDFPAERSTKIRSVDKWLIAGQLGAKWEMPERFTLTLAAAYYYFDNIEGRVGSPCDTNLKGYTCDTDLTRPLFAQKGNTYMALRRPSVFALTYEAAGAAEYQYFGLASIFRELAITGRFELRVARQLKATLDGEFVRNLGFSTKRIAPIALNSRASCGDACIGPFEGGLNGYFARLSIGSPTMDKQWSWSVGLTYRSIESDAVVDAFNDPDFGLGGTNLRGFVFAGAVALTDGVLASVRWMSANQVSGPPYGVDVLHIDVTARY